MKGIAGSGWTHEDEDVCPYGHPKAVCEYVQTNSDGRVRYVCKIRRIEAVEDRMRRGVRPSPSFRRQREDMFIKMGTYTTPIRFTIYLVCGHTTYQRIYFDIEEAMFCYRCSGWFSINRYTNSKGETFFNHDETGAML